MIRAKVWDRSNGQAPTDLPSERGAATFTREEGWHDTSGDWRLLTQIEPSPAILGEDEWLRRMHRRGNQIYLVTAEKQD